MPNKVLVVFVFFFTGCASVTRNWFPSEQSKTVWEPGIDQTTQRDTRNPVQLILDSWVNQPEEKLIQEWGIPDKQMAGEENKKIYEYRKCSGPIARTFGTQYNPSNIGLGSVNQVTVVSQNCARWTFLIAQGIISSNRYTPE